MPSTTIRSDQASGTGRAGRAAAMALAATVGLAAPAAAQDRWGLSEGGAGAGSLVAQVGDGASIFAVVCRKPGLHPVIAVGRDLVGGGEAPPRITLQVDGGRTYALTDLQANRQLYFALVARDVPFFDELAKGTRLTVAAPDGKSHGVGLRGSARALGPVLKRCDGSAQPAAPAASEPPPPPAEPLAPGVPILRTPGFRAEVMPGWCGESASGRLIATQAFEDRPQAIDQLLGALAATLAQVCPEAKRVVVSVHAVNGAHVGDLRLEDGALWRATAAAARDAAAVPSPAAAPAAPPEPAAPAAPAEAAPAAPAQAAPAAPAEAAPAAPAGTEPSAPATPSAAPEAPAKPEAPKPAG